MTIQKLTATSTEGEKLYSFKGFDNLTAGDIRSIGKHLETFTDETIERSTQDVNKTLELFMYQPISR